MRPPKALLLFRLRRWRVAHVAHAPPTDACDCSEADDSEKNRVNQAHFWHSILSSDASVSVYKYSILKPFCQSNTNSLATTPPRSGNHTSILSRTLSASLGQFA